MSWRPHPTAASNQFLMSAVGAALDSGAQLFLAESISQVSASASAVDWAGVARNLHNSPLGGGVLMTADDCLNAFIRTASDTGVVCPRNAAISVLIGAAAALVKALKPKRINELTTTLQSIDSQITDAEKEMATLETCQDESKFSSLFTDDAEYQSALNELRALHRSSSPVASVRSTPVSSPMKVDVEAASPQPVRTVSSLVVNQLRTQLKQMFTERRVANFEEVAAHKDSGIFQEPVNLEDEPDYAKEIKQPMDLSTIRKSLAAGKLPNLSDLVSKLELMIANALQYNPPEHQVYKQTLRLKAFIEKKFKALQAQEEKEFADLCTVEAKRLHIAFDVLQAAVQPVVPGNASGRPLRSGKTIDGSDAEEEAEPNSEDEDDMPLVKGVKRKSVASTAAPASASAASAKKKARSPSPPKGSSAAAAAAAARSSNRRK